MAKSLIQLKTQTSVSSPYSAVNKSSFKDGETPAGVQFDVESGTNTDFADLQKAVARNSNVASGQPNLPFTGYVHDGIHQEMVHFRDGTNAWNNIADDGWWSWGGSAGSAESNPEYGSMWFYDTDYYVPYGTTNSSVKGRVFFNSEFYATLPTGEKAGGIALVTKYDQTSQGVTGQYSTNTNNMIAAARVGNTYKVSFYAMTPTNNTAGTSHLTYGSSNGLANITSDQLEAQFGLNNSDVHIAIGGELEVWVFVAANDGDAFRTGTGANAYHYATNGSHTNMGTKEGIRIKLNGNASNTSEPIGDDLVEDEWRYFEFTFTIDQDNSAGVANKKPRYISTRIDQNHDGRSIYFLGTSFRYYPTVAVANWCVEPINISMKRRLSGTYTNGSDTLYNRYNADTDEEESTGEVKMNANGILYDGADEYQS